MKVRDYELEIVLPATSANLGPAFDAAALALALHLKVRARPAAEFAVSATGRDAAVCSQLENHLIVSVYRETLLRQGKRIMPLELDLDNQIPIGKGCGSSAAARLAGVLLANHFGELDWRGERVLAEAVQREGHPDNAAACWLGGLVVARQAPVSAAGERQEAVGEVPVVEALRFVPAVRWPLLLAVPPSALATEAARRVLPLQYSRADAVSNLQSALMLMAAFIQGRGELLRAGVDDRLHQPYRSALCPLFPALRSLAGDSGVLSVTLSGAGPSVLLVLDPALRREQTREHVARHLERMNLVAELLPVEIENHGARESVTLRD